jgi:hypothetical protein
MRNRHPGPCKDCGGNVAVGEGYFERQRWGEFKVRHVLCVAIKKLEGGVGFKDLTLAQQKAMQPYLTKRQRKEVTMSGGG